MTALRSALYLLFFCLWTGLIFVVALPLLLLPRRWTVRAMRFHAWGLRGALEAVCGVRVEVRGRPPEGPALIAAKHQCMFDTVAPFTFLADPCFVMKKELLIIPFYGWYARKGAMIVVDREGHSRALRKLVADTRDRMRHGRQLVIFPEGHRQDPGAAPDYKPGIAALYKDLDLPCIPVATNSGVHWPAKGFIRRPGVIVFEFLDPIPTGLKRADFMRTLQDRIETASTALLGL